MSDYTYAVITPMRNERENLVRLAASLEGQTVAPQAWVLVDSGSTDGTWELACDLARRLDWVVAVSRPEARMEPGGPIVRAFHAGLSVLPGPSSVVVKLDADISLEPDYFACLLREFERDPRLGIAGGICYERSDGEWLPTHVTGDHVRGAARAYRHECLEAVLPLPEQVGWDGVDELKAQSLGWRTRSLDSLRFYHHRKVGARDGGRAKRWQALGRGSYYMGYGPLYLVLRAALRTMRDRDVAALTMISAYAGEAIRRRPQHPDPGVRAELRRQQRIAALPLRLREALGRRAG